MKDILETIILNWVEKKEEVFINSKETEKTITLEVKVAQSDMGRVIGKQGRVAKALRTVMKSLATKEHKRVNVEFIED